MEEFVIVEIIYHVILAINVLTSIISAMEVLHCVMTALILQHAVPIMMEISVLLTLATLNVQEWIFQQITRNVITAPGIPTTKNSIASHVEMNLKRTHHCLKQ